MRARLLTATAVTALLALLTLPAAFADDHAAGESGEEPNNTAPEGWTALFNGKDIDGWEIKSGKATYKVEDGAIVGTTEKGSPNTFLCTPNTYGDFELKFQVLLHDNGLNSGCQIRSKLTGDLEKFGGRLAGPQVEIEATGNKGSESGLIYGEASGGWQSPNPNQRSHKHFKNQQWNQYHIIAKGRRIQTFINGEQIEDLELKEDYYERFKEGVIGLQVHGVGNRGPFRVRWRNIYIKELD